MDEVVGRLLDGHQTLGRLGIALLLGMLIGIQRGWQTRDSQAGMRIAGIRTHALVGLLGGLTALLSLHFGGWIFAVSLLGVFGICLVAYRVRSQQVADYSVTGAIGLILTFCFGAVALVDDPAIAAAAAVITAFILDNKQEIHGLLHKLQQHELDAGLKLLLISVVMLPLLPDLDMGPGQAINPYQIWWMVVLIAAISFLGYFAVRVGGTEKGILFTSLFAGLSSSTALTLHYARLSRVNPRLNPLLAAGILLACGTMFPRILVYCALINPQLLPALLLPVLMMTMLLYVPAVFIWLHHRKQVTLDQPRLRMKPLDLKLAVGFGLLIMVIMVLGEWLKNWLGSTGILLLAMASGIADVDAITLSLTRMSLSSVDFATAVLGIVLAASVNNIVKSLLALTVGGRVLGARVGGPMLLSMAGGVLVAWWF
ncbi:MgtC/SapB family protein [Zobellella maritima]|uniref:MgtC/SapB family protein n=1 Tax=Zobellella maritima TaxID=2059725 RepID=UPI000E2FF428|nr:MgtC/SapB family protein [Zobellella maritima]